MEWERKKPTCEGWFWYWEEDDECGELGPIPVRVEWTGFVNDTKTPGVRQLDIVWPEEDGEIPMFADANGWWAGPIFPPENS